MATLYDLAAPAKLNLFLHVLGRRSDGYHRLQSVFALIDWCDTLHIESRSDGALTREDLSTPLPEDDLILRAARLLQREAGVPLGAHIGVLKRIPAEAGLGGGSSDAATCLLALNRLWRLDLPLPVLSSIGLRLGADVPFFLAGRNAWVEGIGEQLTPLDLAASGYLVAKPSQGVPTSAIFSDPGLPRETKPATLASFAANPRGFGCNDLQATAQRLCPGIDEALRWLATQGLAGRMTGSGSAVFAWTDSERELASVPDGFTVRRCRGLESHPLVGWAPSERLPVVGASRPPV